MPIGGRSRLKNEFADPVGTRSRQYDAVPRWLSQLSGAGHAPSASTISAAGGGFVGCTGDAAHRERASLSVKTGAHRCRLQLRQRDGHPRAADGAMADGKARPVILRRRSRRCRRQPRDRGGGALCAGPLHAARLWFTGRDQRHALRQAQLQFPPRHDAGREHLPRAECARGASLVSREDGARVHRLHQGQSKVDFASAGVGSVPIWPANCSCRWQA
jgi:hypothetical protein